MMKKILIIGTIASSMAFAKGFNNNNITTGQGMGGTQGKNYSQVANLTEAQQKDLADLKAKQASRRFFAGNGSFELVL